MDRTEVFSLLGKTEMKFSNYYKFTFSFYGEKVIDDVTYRVILMIGGESSDIYTLDVTDDADTLDILVSNGYCALTVRKSVKGDPRSETIYDENRFGEQHGS